jgi:hypothetical protein
MAAINNKKVKWYTDRGLATLVSTDPPTIQLKFLPKGYGAADRSIDEQTRKFYLSDAKNECVICGAAESFRRHNIVPTVYAPLFIQYHDILPFTFFHTHCHSIAIDISTTFPGAI